MWADAGFGANRRIAEKGVQTTDPLIIGSGERPCHLSMPTTTFEAVILSARVSQVCPAAIPAMSLTHPPPSNKLKTFHIEPNLWQTAFMSSFPTGP